MNDIDFYKSIVKVKSPERFNKLLESLDEDKLKLLYGSISDVDLQSETKGAEAIVQKYKRVFAYTRRHAFEINKAKNSFSNTSPP